MLSTADVGLCPDPLNPLNDVSTMNKTMEYMAFGLPVVAFDLRETRVSAADAARLRASPTTSRPTPAPSSTSSTTRGAAPRWAATGGSASSEHLAWEHQQDGYVRVFDELVGRKARVAAATSRTGRGRSADAAAADVVPWSGAGGRGGVGHVSRSDAGPSLTEVEVPSCFRRQGA